MPFSPPDCSNQLSLADNVKSVGIKSLYTNATSLNKLKLHELSAVCRLEGIKLVFITETWFSDSSKVNLAGFNLFRRDRADGKGGVAIYVHDSLRAIELSDPSLRAKLGSDAAEQVWCQLVNGDEIVLLGCIYRPPLSYRSTDAVEQHIKTAESINDILIAAKGSIEGKKLRGLCVLGDFNYPGITWFDDGTVRVHNSANRLANLGYEFWETINDLSLAQCVVEPTFVYADSTSSNVLDLLLTDERDRISEISMRPPLGTANQGHKSIVFTFLGANDSKTRFDSRKLNYGRGNYSKISSSIARIDWTTQLAGLSVNDAYNEFLSEYKRICDSFIPARALAQKNKIAWSNKSVEVRIKKKKNLWHANQRTGWRCASLIDKYKAARNDAAKQIKKSIREYEMSLAGDKKNPKRLFSYVNSKRSTRAGITAIEKGGVTHTNNNAIADALNEHFCSVFNDDDDDDLPIFESSNVDHEMPRSFHLARDAVIKKLEKLERHKAIGVDGVSPYVLRECAEAFATPLLIIFERSMEEGVVPSSWREANVTPIFKKGSRLDPSNYRPVSLTSVVCKVLESIVRDEIMYHLVKNKLISVEQHGFIPRKACVTNLLETVDFATTNLSNKTPTDIVFLDFSKAFDKVSHRRLLTKLHTYGVRGQIYSWIAAFLSNRKQRVVLADAESQWVDVLSGVPQGSVLGPVLFVIYVNDLPGRISNTCKLFADDCKIMASVNCQMDADHLQRDLDRVCSWCSEWKMVLNVSKCHVMHCGKNNQKFEYTLVDDLNSVSKLCTTTRERDLGIILTPDLKWHDQACNSASKGNRMLGVLKNTFVSRNAGLWKKLYTTYVRPQLEFAVAVWNPYLKKDVEIIERVQHRATRIPNELRELSYEERCDKLGLTSLTNRRTRGDMIQQFKITSGLDEVRWARMPIQVDGIAGKRPQLRREVVIGCNQRHNFFTNRVASDWNKLTDDTVNSGSTTSFKSRFDRREVATL